VQVDLIAGCAVARPGVEGATDNITDNFSGRGDWRELISCLLNDKFEIQRLSLINRTNSSIPYQHTKLFLHYNIILDAGLAENKVILWGEMGHPGVKWDS